MLTNYEVTRKLLEHARYVEAHGRNLYRVRAYRRAAETVGRLDRPLADLVAEQGRAGLEELPGIGRSLSRTLVELVETGEITRDETAVPLAG